jgi:hypothetical protein
MTVSTELATTLSGAVQLPVTLGALVYSGCALVRRPLAGSPTMVRLVGAGIATAWLLVVVALVLLFGQCFHAWAFAAVSLVSAGACRRWLSRPPPGRNPARARGGEALLVVLCGTLLLAQLARALVMPPIAWDSLTYHLTIPAMWVQHGGYWQWSAPDAFGDYSRFPGNGELFGAFLLLPFHGDLLVNLFGLPFLLLAGAAVQALATELGASRRTAGLAAALWMFSPPAFAYVTTQYVDLPMAAETLGGWLFVVRFLRTRAVADAVLAGAAFGLAVGTKHLALVPAAIAGLLGVCLLLRFRGRVARGIWLGMLAAAVVGVPWYLRNWIETGNPVYPFPVALGGQLLFAGSPFQANVPELPSPDTSYFAKLLTFQPGFAPITLGPPLLLAAVLGLLGFLRGLSRPSRAAIFVLAAAIATDLLLFSSEAMRRLREHWADGTQRFLLVPFGLLLVGMATLARTGQGRAQRFVLTIGVGALALDFAAANFATLARDEAVAWIVVALLAMAGALVAASGRRRGWLVMAAALAWFSGLPLLAHYRIETRGDTYAHGFDLHPTARDEIRAWIGIALLGQDIATGAVSRGWREVDDPDRPLRIAFVAGWTAWGHNWMVYPLLGRGLQNEVVHVPATQSGALGTYQPGVPREALATPQQWIERLRERGVQVLFVALPAPPELAWAEAHPEVFTPRASGGGFRVFDIR